MFKYQLLLIFFLASLCTDISAQGNLAEKKARAQQLFYSKQFAEAAAIYKSNPKLLDKDKDATFFAGVSYYHSNDLERAEKTLLSLTDKDKVAFPEVLFFLGKTYHARNEFTTAAAYYKAYLKILDKDAPNRPTVLEDLRRSANGISIQFKTPEAFAENLGRNVNTSYDEFSPVVSPNFNEKLYFSSMRVGNSGGRRNTRGLPDEENGYYYSDIYSCQLSRGVWTDTKAFDYLINSPKHEILLDISSNGSTLVYFKGDDLYNGTIFIDTFQKADQRSLRSDPFIGPMYGEVGDRSPHFANDTVLIFSSRQGGGYGGYDLYQSIYRTDGWSTPRNLGPEINSSFDEISPFLSRNGLTLYFSSNDSQKSIGGLDVFRSNFDTTTYQWSSPENLGLPINSAADDADFRLTPDGFAAFFSSSRKDGYGLRDIYIAFFEEYREEQTAPYVAVEEEYVEAVEENQVLQENQQLVESISIAFNNKDELFSTENTKLLDKIVKLQDQQEARSIVITGYSNSTLSLPERLFEAVEFANEAQGYFLQKGIELTSLFSRSADIKEIASSLQTSVATFDYKLVISLIDTEILAPISLEASASKSAELDYTKIISDKLLYKIQIASVTKPYQKKLFKERPDAMMEKSTVKGYYRCTLGLFDNFEAANKLKQELRAKGIKSAFVVPYLVGKRLEPKEVKKYRALLPDLNNYKR